MAIAIGLGWLFALLALVCAVFWTVGIIEGLRRDRQGTLERFFARQLVARGFLTILAVPCIPVPLTILAVRTNIVLSDSLSPGLSYAALALFIYGAVLGGITAVLYFKPKQPLYLFHLPGDAEKVRRGGCEDGIWLAAVTYPTVIIRDWLDTLTRAIQVSARENAFPQGKGAEVQLTNDFAVYCNLRAEGCEKGYYGLIDRCHTFPDPFKGILAQLQQGDPASREIKTLLKTLVQQILYGGEGDPA